MKLVILHPTLPAYRKDFFEKLNDQLMQKDIELIVIHGTSFFKKSIKPDEDPHYKTYPLITKEYNPFGYRIVLWSGIFSKIKSIRPDVIIILFCPGNITFWLVQLYCYFKGIKLGLWSNGSVRHEITGLKRKIRSIFLNFFTRRAQFHICYGTRYEKELLAAGYERSRIFVAQNTINIEKIIAQNSEVKKVTSEDQYNFLFVGALIEGKNLDLAVRVIARLISEGYKIKFRIIGAGAMIEELRSLVRDEKMEDHISVLGYISDEEIPAFFNEADIFFLPGTGGLAVNEAMAYGLAVITTIADGTVLDLVYEGENGYYLKDIPDFDNIFEVCKKALQNSKSHLREMGNTSRKLIVERASLSNMVNNFEKAVLYGMENRV